MSLCFLHRRGVLVGVVSVALFGWLSAATASRASEPASASATARTVAPAVAPVVVARVGGEPIYAGEVAGELRSIVKDRPVDRDAKTQLEAAMLAQLVDRRLVLNYLTGHKQAVDPHLVDARIQQMASLFKQRNSSLAEYLAKRGVTQATLEAELNWGLSWQSYLDRHVTDAVLGRYFDAHRRDFDGTEVRVAQLLLPMPEPATASAIQALKAKAAEIRRDIVDGKLNFDEAVTRHSSAPSKRDNGDLGFVARHGSLPEALTTAAFALEKGRISQPVVTRFGVHLLRVNEVEPGKKSWRDVEPALKAAVTQQGFQRIAESQRGKVPVEFTGTAPYFDPKTGRLVTPAGGP